MYTALLAVVAACGPGDAFKEYPTPAEGEGPSAPEFVVPDPRPTAAAPAMTEPFVAEVRVHVRDRDGNPVEGALVTVALASARTDPRGNAAFERVPGGPQNVVVSAPDQLDVSRLVDLGPRDVIVVEVALTERHQGKTHGGFTLTVPSGMLDTLDRPLASVAASITGFAPGGDDLASVPASLLGRRASGNRVTLRSHGVAVIRVEDDGGRSAFPPAGKTFTVTRTVAGGELAAGTKVPVWSLDEVNGLWLEEPSLEATVTAGVLTAHLPRAGSWAFAFAEAEHCFDVTLEQPAGLEPASLEVEIIGPGYHQRRRQRDGLLSVRGVPQGSAAVHVYAGGALVGQLDAEPEAAPACPSYTIAIDTSLELGADPGVVLVRAVSGNCDANGLRLRVLQPGAAPIHEGPLTHASFLVRGLAAGTWRFELLDAAMPGAPVAQGVAKVPESCPAGGCETLLLDIEVPERFALIPPGGCIEPACRGPECDSCVAARVVDGGERPQAGSYVSFYEPIVLAHATDEHGDVCVDVPDGAGAFLTAMAEGNDPRPVAMQLPRGATCASGGCASRVMRVTPGCPEGRINIASEARILGMRHPGYTPEGNHDDPWRLGPSLWSLRAHDAQIPPLGLAAGETVEVGHGCFGHLAIRQDAVGAESSQILTARCHASTGAIAMKLSPPPHRPGTWMIDGDSSERSVRIDFDSMTGAPSGHYRAVGGHVEVTEVSTRHVVLQYDLELEREEGAGPAALRVSGAIDTPVYVQAHTPFLVTNQLSRPLNGAALRVVTDEDALGASYGPTGHAAASADDARGETAYCVPSTGWYELVTEKVPGLLPTVSARAEWRGTSPVVWDSPLEHNSTHVRQRALWFDLSYVWTLYTANGAAPESIARNTTVLGSAYRRKSDGTLEYLTISEVYVEAPNGTKIHGHPLGQDFRFADSGFTFAILSVPGGPTRTYVLRAFDESGTEVPELRQTFSPRPGSVFMPHN